MLKFNANKNEAIGKIKLNCKIHFHQEAMKSKEWSRRLSKKILKFVLLVVIEKLKGFNKYRFFLLFCSEVNIDAKTKIKIEVIYLHQAISDFSVIWLLYDWLIIESTSLTATYLLHHYCTCFQQLKYVQSEIIITR